ncbi:YfhO family protein [Companilactobacillus allii]|uniref:Membrane protein 6-pyruvoyl-tetrahydropterin synthase-related domain-containing protein n=1 Tax=Companilactobacillus allii TaxID=1847728 RepID=A0A1P8Q5R0_9LACO|nr:YfhO family protein [Companilactobacillus allii]APX73175.1 hypothetical protein BTM29_11715 [Companilactobacillus allii]USQ67983.1 YfhO family protein [Companilactobacillus allii]
MKKLVKEKYLILLLFLFISIALIGIIDWHYGYVFATGDFHYHLDRIETLASSIKHLNFWPKVDGHFIGGYGYASSLFYPDLFLYPAALLRVIGATPVFSYLFTLVMINFVTLWIGFIAGKRMSLSPNKALLFTLIYTFNAYRLQTLFSRQDLGELMGAMFFPLVLSELINLKRGNVKQWYVLAFAMIGISCSHTISLFMIIVFASLFVLLNIRIFWNKKRILAIVKAAGLTIGISAAVYLPILEQMQGQKYALTTDPLIKVTNEILPMKNLILNSLTNQVFHANTVNLGAIIFLGLAVYAIYNLIHRRNLDLTLIALVFFIACTNLFPWGIFSHSIFAMIQFPWRFFSVISLIVAYLLANDDLNLFRNQYVIYGFVALLSIVTAGLSQQTLAESPDKLESYQQFNKVDSFFIGAGHEYLPSEVSYPEVLDHKDRLIKYNKSNVKISNSTINRQYIAFNFNTHGKTSKVQLPLIYYKGYQSEVYGNTGSSTTPRISSNGLTTIELVGSGTVKVQYENTFIQKFSLMVSASVLLLTLLMLLKKRRDNTSLSDSVPLLIEPVNNDYVFVYKIINGYTEPMKKNLP